MHSNQNLFENPHMMNLRHFWQACSYGGTQLRGSLAAEHTTCMLFMFCTVCSFHNELKQHAHI